MRVKMISAFGALALSVVLFQSGCEWSSSGDSMNTSKGAGVNINFSGVYHGTGSGGKAVSSTSGGSITRLVISQAGNAVEVVDNHGSRYKGTIGSPGAIRNPSGGVYNTGDELVQSQMSFSGTDNSSGKKVQFVGVVHAVTVTDIRGTVTGSGSTNSSSQTDSSDQQDVQTSRVNNGTNTVVTTIVTVGSPGDPFYQQTTTTVTYDNASGREVSRTQSSVGSNSSSDSSSSGSYTEYSITEANTQYRLEGTWIEEGGKSSGVDALSSGSSGLITTTPATPATPATPSA